MPPARCDRLCPAALPLTRSYAPSAGRGLPAPVDVFDSNESPYDFFSKQTHGINLQHLCLNRYPATDLKINFVKKLATHLGVQDDNLVLGNGSTELIDAALKAFVNPLLGQRLLLADPSFLAYQMSAEILRIETDVFDVHAAGFDLDKFAECVKPRTRVVICANPNNPTGHYASAADLKKFLAKVPLFVTVVLDQAYIEYVTQEDPANCATWLGCRSNLLILRTFSKAWGLAGVRLGYAIGNPTIVEQVKQALLPLSVNSLALHICGRALDAAELLEATRQTNARQRDRLSSVFRRWGFLVENSQANFLWVDLRRDAAAASLALARQKISIRPVSNYGSTTAVRISIGTQEQNDRLLDAMHAEVLPLELTAAVP
jgi:histidinol-phosphate aminotransferase